MAKQSPAKIKKLAAEAKRAGAQRRQAKASERQIQTTNSSAEIEKYLALEGAWLELGIGEPARRALIDDGLFELSDLRKTSLAALKELHGMGPNAIRILVAEMKKSDLTFRN